MVNLIYWRDIRKTAIVFTAMIFLLLSIAFYSIISVAAYLSLAILAVTLSFVTKSRVLAFIQKTPVTHPFRQHLDKDVSIPRERVHQFIDSLTGHAVIIAKEVRRLYLVEDVPSSLKVIIVCGESLYVCVACWMNKHISLLHLCLVCIAVGSFLLGNDVRWRLVQRNVVGRSW